MKRKLLFFVSVAFLVVCTLVCFVGCEEEETPVDNSGTKILVMGDSIAEGILGPTPIIKREDFAYISVVGQINGFTYRNRAISGHKSGQFLDYISMEKDDTAYTHITEIMETDVICVSILGNDLLHSGFANFAKAALQTPSDFTQIDEILSESLENIRKIVARFKELNPDVELIIQTVYNPMYPGSTTMKQYDKDAIVEMYPDVVEEDFYSIAGMLINRLNNVLYDYLLEDPYAFTILDVNAKFDEIYSANPDRLDRLIYDDCIHPSNEGHAVIACLLQEKLEGLGLADHDYAIANYKELRKNQLDRLYSGTTVDIKAVKSAIDKASTYDLINVAFFDAVDGVVSTYYQEETVASEKEFIEETTTYYINSLSLWDGDFVGLLDTENTYVTLTSDGKLELRLTPNTATIGLVNLYLGTAGDPVADVSGLEIYIKGLFPQNSIEDMQKTFERLGTDLGLYVEGLDFTDPVIVNMFESIKENATIPSGVSLPEDIAFVIKGDYEIKEIHSNTQDEPFTAVWLGEYTENGEPYIVMTLFTDENGNECILIRNELLGLTVIAVA